MKFQAKQTNINERGNKVNITINTDDPEVMRQLLNMQKSDRDYMDAKADEVKKAKGKRTAAKPKALSMPKETVKGTCKKSSKNSKAKGSKKTNNTLLLEAPKMPNFKADKKDIKPLKPTSNKSNKKPKISRKAVSGKAKITHETRNLSKEQIDQANHLSFNGNRGTNLKKEYESCRKKIEFSGLSEKQKQKLLDQLYKRYTPILKYESQWVSPMVSGPAKYPQAKMDKTWERMMQANSDFVDWWKNIEPTLIESTKNQKQKDQKAKEDKKKDIENIKINFNKWFSNAQYFRCEWLLDDALKLDEKLYKELFEKLDSVKHYRKNTNQYKRYKLVTEGKVTAAKIQKKEEEDNSIIYQCPDYTIRNVSIDAGKRIGISFTLRPKQQLIYALKSRKYTWHYGKSMWICKPEKFDLNWAKDISKQYEKYL